MGSRHWWLSGARCAALGALLTLSLTALGCESGDDEDHDHADGDHDHAEGDGGEEHSHDPNVKIGTPSGATCPDDNTLTYDNFGKDFMTKYCVRCHSTELTGDARNGAPADHDFNVFEGIIGVAMHVDQFAASGPDSTNTTMPPNGDKPTKEEREKLGQWLACELDMLQ